MVTPNISIVPFSEGNNSHIMSYIRLVRSKIFLKILLIKFNRHPCDRIIK